METYGMGSAIFKFFVARQSVCEKPLDVVTVTWLGGGEDGYCMENARNTWMSDSSRYKLVSGWLVAPYDKRWEWRHFVQHWWNFDTQAERHIDTTPNIGDGSIYIVDQNICDFVLRHDRRLIAGESLVDVVFKDNRLQLVRPYGDRFMVMNPESLATEVLFAPVLRPN